MENNNAEKIDNLPVSEILNRIKNGLVDPILLSKSTRQMCVEVLIIEGYAHSSIASLFKVSDRTIRRDLVEIRRRNAVTASPELTKQLVGELIATEQNHYASLKQIARIKDAYPDEKTRAEAMAWKARKELIEKLFLIGYITNNDGRASKDKPVNNDNTTVDLSQEDKDIRKRMHDLSPMDRERLLEKLRRDILDMGAKFAEENIDAGKEDEKKEVPPSEIK